VGGVAFEIKLFSSVHFLPDTMILRMQNKEGNICAGIISIEFCQSTSAFTPTLMYLQGCRSYPTRRNWKQHGSLLCFYELLWALSWAKI